MSDSSGQDNSALYLQGKSFEKQITVRDEITGGLILIFLVGRRGASRVRMMFGLIHHHFSFLEEET